MAGFIAFYRTKCLVQNNQISAKSLANIPRCSGLLFYATLYPRGQDKNERHLKYRSRALPTLARVSRHTGENTGYAPIQGGIPPDNSMEEKMTLHKPRKQDIMKEERIILTTLEEKKQYVQKFNIF
ncbi:MAG: hypothetical protein IKU26_05150, partial [Clostridia bacterium]|nr:hypothetical protein [Clostridia bacterium]